MLPPEQKAAFDAFYDAVRDPRRLDRRSAALVGLAAALAVGCEP
jgi:hypothetical protein